jgi:SAM-dependent methyltransferase
MEQWQSAQRQFVAWQAEYSRENAAADLRGADDIHAQFELTGRVLDIGGSAGLARRYLTDAQPYLSVDPDRSWRQRLDVYASVYPGVAKPFAQVQALAEQLPLRSQTFDSILMRSVIDHCYDAHLALSEAYRVLNPGGRLVIGLSVGGRRARARALIPKFGAKGAGIEIARRVRSFARSGFRWHGTGHVFHIDGDDVPALLGEHGFRMVKQVTSSLIPTVAFFEVTRPVDARE